jgi:uncharacterized RDD family membrane protein YckC
MLGLILLGAWIKWIYYVLLESSGLKATIGKRIIGIEVTDGRGNRISLQKAHQRYLAKILSIAIFYIGFMLVSWTPRKRGLHDLITGTFVKQVKR